MIIHVVEPFETIDNIAAKYDVSVTRLISDNGINNPYNLVVGQTIVIVYPQETYIVKEGDTLASIAAANNINQMQLLRNNSFLSEREYIYPGESLVISYPKSDNKLSTNGYAYPFIDIGILKKTLPYLTYLSIFNYRTTAEAEIIGIDDTALIRIAKDYGVAPIMLLSTLSSQGSGSIEVVYSILNNDELIERQINNILNILNSKGYYGLNITFQYINTENTQIYNNYLSKLTTRLNKEGFPVWVTITPRQFYTDNGITFERINYSDIGKIANKLMFLSYSWGYTFGPPLAPTSVKIADTFLDYALTQVPPEKVFIGLPVIGYDWQLPYEIGISMANSLTPDAAIALAAETGSFIQYDDESEAPFFEYIENGYPIPRQHIVWFKDARSINAIISLVPEHGLYGAGIWNIMNFFAQMWLIINSQYEIERISDIY